VRSLSTVAILDRENGKAAESNLRGFCYFDLKLLQSAMCHVAVFLIAIDPDEPAAKFFCDKGRRSGATERVKDHAAFWA